MNDKSNASKEIKPHTTVARWRDELANVPLGCDYTLVTAECHLFARLINMVVDDYKAALAQIESLTREKAELQNQKQRLVKEFGKYIDP